LSFLKIVILALTFRLLFKFIYSALDDPSTRQVVMERITGCWWWWLHLLNFCVRCMGNNLKQIFFSSARWRIIFFPG